MKKITFIALLTLTISNAIAQKAGSSLETARKYLKEKGEVILRFKASDKAQFLELNQILSVDHHHVDENLLEVQAYVNQKQFDKFLKFGLQYEVTKEDNEIPQELTARQDLGNKSGANANLATNAWDTTWDAYPKYSEYVAKMQYWATTYPSLCKLEEIPIAGGTTANGRKLYVLKISDNPTIDEAEPEFFYTSSMHGDEITGYPTMLHFIDYLLTNYGSLTEVSNLINGTELYINPLANPDGSYKTAGNDIFNPGGAANTPTRANAASIDLNRNYPDPLGSTTVSAIHPDGELYQEETEAFLNFEATRHFVLGANYHGGTEVVNFPWDTSTNPGSANFSIHPHNNYFKYISQEYASLCQAANGTTGYMDTVYNSGQFPGTTNGAAWYSVFGGRQDWNNFYNHNKEMTIEISDNKTVSAATLPSYFTRNRQALLNYVKQASYGLQGTVKDESGNPIHAKLYVVGTSDGRGSWVDTSPTVGDFHKVQIAGSYTVTIEAPGYVTQTANVTLVNGSATNLNIVMVSATPATPTASNISIGYGQTATLNATGTSTLKWYNSASSTTVLGTGTSFVTPALNASTSYWVESELISATVGPLTSGTTTTNTTTAKGKFMTFSCTVPTKLKSVNITTSAATQLLIELQNSSSEMIESKVIRLSASGNQDIPLNFFVPVGTGLKLVLRELYSGTITTVATGLTYPYTSSSINITAGALVPFFNWKLEQVKSARKEVVVTVNPITWNGSVNDLWNVANNWTPNTVPTGSEDVLIASGNPSLNVDFTLANGNVLTLNGTGSLVVQPNKVLKIAGTANFNNNSILFKSDATGTGIFGELTGTVTGISNVTVERYISGKRAFRFLTPSVTTTTSIYQNWQNNGASTAGIGTHITGGTSGGFDITLTNNPSLHTYNAQASANTTGFNAVPNTNATVLKAGVGYRLLVRGDRNVVLTNASAANMNVPTTLFAKGTLTTGSVTFNTTGSSPVLMNNTTNTQTNGYTLIGNPYVSPVDWHAVTKTGVNNNAYYTWDPTLGTAAQRGRYVVYTQTSATTGTSNIYLPSTGTDVVTNRRYIQTGQAVFVKNAVLGTPATLTFAESNKATNSAYVFKSSSEGLTSNTNSSLYLTLFEPNELALGGTPIDGALALFGADFSNTLDENDVDKLNASGENVAFIRANKSLAIETLAPVVANDELFVKTTQLESNKNYTFRVNTTDFDTSVTAKMVDLYLNSETPIDLTQPSFVTFATTSDANSYGSDRFKIVFNNAALGNGSFTDSAISIYPNPITNNQFTLALPLSVTGKVTVSITNMLGQQVYNNSADASQTMQIMPKNQLQEGVYVVNISNNGNVVQAKIIVKN